MNVLFDSNIILSAILPSNYNHTQAANLLKLANSDLIYGHITASSVTDIYYIARKHLGDGLARIAIQDLLNTFLVIPVNGKDCQNALLSLMKDFEDALVVACADKSQIDYIVTEDRDFLAETTVNTKVISTAELLALVNKGNV